MSLFAKKNRAGKAKRPENIEPKLVYVTHKWCQINKSWEMRGQLTCLVVEFQLCILCIKNEYLFPYPFGYDYVDLYLQYSWKDVAQ